MPNNRKQYILDAKGKILGRLAVKVAKTLSGKGKVDWAPNVDGGDHVTVINAEKVKVTGNKEEQKTYYRHSGYPGGIKSLTLKEVREKTPERVIERAVKGMLPKNKLGKAAYGRLTVIKGEEGVNKDKMTGLEV